MRLFKCFGCGLSIVYSALCIHCSQNIKFNKKFIESPVAHIKAIAPLFYSIGTTHSVFKAWKNKRGLLLERALFSLHSELEQTLKEIRFQSIVPIPQHSGRSWARGHESALSAAQYFSKMLNIPIQRYLGFNPLEDRTSLLRAMDRAYSENPFYSIQKPKNGETILLVDDLITTGNTLSRAVSRLREANPTVTLYAASLGFRPSRTINTETHNESPIDPLQLSQEQDFYSHFQYKI